MNGPMKGPMDQTVWWREWCRRLWFEENRLTKPVLDMRALAQVHTLRLFGNPIEYLPEMHHAFSLRSLSLVNVGSCTTFFFFFSFFFLVTFIGDFLFR